MRDADAGTSRTRSVVSKCLPFGLDRLMIAEGRRDGVGLACNAPCRSQRQVILTSRSAITIAAVQLKLNCSFIAKPSNSRLPSTSSSSTSPFCRSCLSNQTLIMNMLANYLPDDSVGPLHELQVFIDHGLPESYRTPHFPRSTLRCRPMLQVYILAILPFALRVNPLSRLHYERAI